MTLSRGPSHFYMKISDQGGGLAFENAEKIWKFSYSAYRIGDRNDRNQVCLCVEVCICVCLLSLSLSPSLSLSLSLSL